jgi:hypothetical protein
MEKKIHQPLSYNFICEKCDFKCHKKGDWNRHLLTKKHLEINGSKQEINLHHMENGVKFCKCGKHFNTASGLWKHEKKCPQGLQHISKEMYSDVTITSDLIMLLVQQNKELQTMLVNQAKEHNDNMLKVMQQSNSNNANNSYNTNSNNKTFNLQFFLNETCKNALNMSEFISNLEVTLEDLEETGSKGYVEGISNIFIKGLKELDITERPIHCSDVKRETIYIKDNDEWIKDEENKPKIVESIKQITHKNIGQIYNWQKKYPDYNDPESRSSDKYQKLIFNSMSGSSKEECNDNYNKIIKNVAKEVVIQKN